IVDERDPLVRYTGSWNNAGTPAEFQGTTRWSATQGSTASFTFTGTSVLYYGGATGQPISASIVLDGAPPVLFSPPSGSLQTTNNLIFSSGDLSDGGHTLVVTAENGNPVWVDYF
ncbi:hypothetical protein B0H10DRAFT_1761018, partial [Mycena sp. CBHHK59/15]